MRPEFSWKRSTWFPSLICTRPRHTGTGSCCLRVVKTPKTLKGCWKPNFDIHFSLNHHRDHLSSCHYYISLIPSWKPFLFVLYFTWRHDDMNWKCHDMTKDKSSLKWIFLFLLFLLSLLLLRMGIYGYEFMKLWYNSIQADNILSLWFQKNRRYMRKITKKREILLVIFMNIFVFQSTILNMLSFRTLQRCFYWEWFFSGCGVSFLFLAVI